MLLYLRRYPASMDIPIPVNTDPTKIIAYARLPVTAAEKPKTADSILTV